MIAGITTARRIRFVSGKISNIFSENPGSYDAEIEGIEKRKSKGQRHRGTKAQSEKKGVKGSRVQAAGNQKPETRN
jgi:hypothetical protein